MSTWEELFGGPDFSRRLKERGMSAGLRNSPLRGVAWKVFLEVLPPYVPVSEWPSRIRASRAHYDSLVASHYVDPHEVEGEDQHQSSDPLSQSEDSPWNAYFRNQELQREIDQDLTRTYPDQEFFRRPSVMASLNRILFVYAREHPEIGYRQGMHEMLAPMFFVLSQESDRAEGEGVGNVPECFRCLVERSGIEADAFGVFSALMNTAGEFFLGTAGNTGRSTLLAEEAGGGETTTPVVRRCRKIFHGLLKQKDAQLYEHLAVECQIEPQLFAMRWLKLLFGREFHLQDLLVLWDAIFAYGRSLALVDHICVCMLVYIRDQLLAMDQVATMKRLLRYPPVEDISLFVVKAVELCTPKPVSNTAASPAIPSAPSPISVFAVTPPTSPPAMLSPPPPAEPRRPSSASVSSGGNHPLSTAGATTTTAQDFAVAPKDQDVARRLNAEIKRLQDERIHTGARVERLVYSLQQEMRTKTELAENDILIRHLAELKEIRAILAGLLTDTAADGDY